MDRSDVLLERLTSLHPRKIDLSLGRTFDLLEKLGRPQDRLPPTIHVAGTNGKGSTIAFMRAIIEAAGKRVHVYTSPHLVRFHERIRLAGKLVEEDALARALQDCERVNAGAPITLFEITTVAAFKLFSEVPADVLLLEVGLGGRFDSTNVLDRPLACVITPVSIDHVDFLGDTIEKIAFEKAGILKRGVRAIIADQDLSARAVIETRAAELRAPLFIGGQDFGAREERGRLVFEDGDGLLDLPPPKLPGRHQISNAATAIATLRATFPNLSDDDYARGMVTVDWPARLQRLTRGALVDLAPPGADLWLDGGHNADGGRALAESMADIEDRAPRPLIMIVGMLTTKDSAAFLSPFKGLAREIIAIPVAGDHAGRAPAEIVALARGLGCDSTEAASMEAALTGIAGRDWPSPPRILVAGSLYLAGAVLAANGTPPE
jgi:dihydrofolate synthase/folylpolyglutamate synthase